MDIDYLGPILLAAVGLVGLLILLITHGLTHGLAS